MQNTRDNNALIRSGEAWLVGWSRQMLYSEFIILPRSVVRLADFVRRSDNADVMSLALPSVYRSISEKKKIFDWNAVRCCNCTRFADSSSRLPRRILTIPSSLCNLPDFRCTVSLAIQTSEERTEVRHFIHFARFVYVRFRFAFRCRR